MGKSASRSFLKVVKAMVETITAAELKVKMGKKEPFFLLDVRQLDEYNQFNLGGTLIPLDQLEQRIHEIPKDQSIIVYCRSGYRSQIAAEWLTALGFSVANLQGGILSWAS